MKSFLVTCLIVALAAGADGCGGAGDAACRIASSSTGATTRSGHAGGSAPKSCLPLEVVADVPLPGTASRFDYQDIDAARGQLVIAHMNDASVVVFDLKKDTVTRVLPNIPTARGVVVADDVGRIFVSSSPDQLVIIDNTSFTEIARVATGDAPDGVGWDPVDQIVGVSDQTDGAVSLIAGAGTGARRQVPLGVETGNVQFDAGRRLFWASVVNADPPDQLVAIDPVSGEVKSRLDLPGCEGAHGLRFHPDGASALVACENNDVLARVDLDGAHAVVTAPTGAGPDVLSIDPDLGWLYVAAESGDLVVFDIGQRGLVAVDHEHPGDNAHSVAVDPATHRVYFPLMVGPKGDPVLRIMRPALE
jgi:DNA-binding beta-propeller fold protein YncE